MSDFDKFGNRSKLFKCDNCGKLTRDTMGNGCSLCADCYKKEEEENGRIDKR